jgi:hypothetical protein
MKLGEMLVRDGRLTDAQLQSALAQQGRDGGRLGTVMFEMGLVDLDALTVYLGLELAIPIATGAMLERAKRSAVRLLTPQMAFRYKVVPLLDQHRQLIAAVEDPHDLDALDAILEETGHRVLPRVAPEIRIYYYIERYYGTPRPSRFVRFGDSPRGDQKPSFGLPNPPLPGLPPIASQPVAAPGPSPTLRRASTEPDAPKVQVLESEAEDLVITLESNDAEPAEQAPMGRPAEPQRRRRNSTINTVYGPISASVAIEQMERCDDRSAISDALLSFATSMFDAAILFLVRDNLALGWKASGDVQGRTFVDHLLIPLDAPSMFQTAIRAESHIFDGEPTPCTIHDYLYKVLGCEPPRRATAVVATIGSRPVNVLYGHRTTRPDLTTDEKFDIARVCTATVAAYARLIASAKS